MAYCAPLGIPLSQFLAWPIQDQEAALAWQDAKSESCSSCGAHPDDPWHIEYAWCQNCAAMESAGKSDEAKIPGNHIRLARGESHDCDRCST